MKRLVILTLLLVPAALMSLRHTRTIGFEATVHEARYEGRHHGSRQVVIRDHHGLRVVRVSDPAKAEATPEREQIQGQAMATPERASASAWQALDKRLHERLSRYGVGDGWTPPREAVRNLVTPGAVTQIDKDYGTLYVQELTLDTTDARLRQIARLHDREIGRQHLFQAGGIVAFVLVCLATLVGYIRADEATKGYRTRSLRIVSLVAVSAAAAGLYHLLV
jgi:hypothetical protein